MAPDDNAQEEHVQVPCAHHLTFSTLANEGRRCIAWYKANPDTQDPRCDALLAADELAVIALGADPAFLTVSSAETYTGKIVVEDIRIKAVVVDGQGKDVEVDVPTTGTALAWVRDASGWQMTGTTSFVGEAGEPKRTVTSTAVLVAMVATCFRHGFQVTVTISELCG